MLACWRDVVLVAGRMAVLARWHDKEPVARQGEGDATVLAVLPDTAGPAGPSVVDKVVGGDGDATVLAVLLYLEGKEAPNLQGQSGVAQPVVRPPSRPCS